MPDYVYLLKNRLSPAQQNALKQVRDAAREAGMTVFLTGGAVRDLTSGSPVRDLDVTVQGNALKLKKSLEKAGGELLGEYEPTRTLFFWFPGSVRLEVSSSRREEYPKPGKPVYHWAPILEDLRRRDFTANAMAISLNEGSYGLLLDPLNGVADIEARSLRLVSSYGFLEDSSRLVRATRFLARSGWTLDERTQTRFENAKAEGVIDSISSYLKGYELEEIGHEEDAYKALRALEDAGWMKHLFPSWTHSKADAHGLENLHRVLIQLLMQGIHPDLFAAQMELLTAKMQPKDLASLKKLFPRQGSVAQWKGLENAAKEFAKALTSKEAATPSATWKLLTSYQPEPVLWLAYSSKSAPVQAKFKNFFTVWPEARQKVPTALMLELRITPDLPEYSKLLEEMFFQLIDGKLQTDEEMKAFLEPYSPPAPPPPVSIKRSRGRKAEPKIKVDEEEEEVELRDLDSLDEDESGEDKESDGEDEDEGEGARHPAKSAAVKGKAAAKTAAPAKETKPAVKATAPSAKKEEPKVAAKAVAQPQKPAAKKAAPTKPVKAEAKKLEPAKKAAKVVAKPSPKPAAKKPAVKSAAVKKPVKPAAKAASKPAKKTKPPVKKVSKPHKPAPKPAKAAKKKR